MGVNSDSSARSLKGKGRPILTERARASLVAALAAVDYVVIFDELNVESLLREFQPDVHAKGTDYTPDTVPERDLAALLGIRVAIVGDPKHHSTRDLLDRAAPEKRWLTRGFCSSGWDRWATSFTPCPPPPLFATPFPRRASTGPSIRNGRGCSKEIRTSPK